MSVETDVLSLLPQYGEKPITSTLLTTWKTIATTMIAQIDSRISGTALDALLTAKMRELGLIYLGLDSTTAQEDYLKLLEVTQASMLTSNDKIEVTYEKLKTIGKLPDYWCK